MKKMPKKNEVKKNVKKGASKPRLTKEERAELKAKKVAEREAKKAERAAEREAKKQKEAEKKAAAKAKKAEAKAKKAARLQKQKERKAALKLKAKERAAAKKARELARSKKAKNDPKKPVKARGKKIVEKKISAKEKIEAERNEWKALSALRRYVKDNAKLLASLPEDKRIKRINKLQKMGYSIGLNEDGIPSDIGYSFCSEIKQKKTQPKSEEGTVKKVRKPRKPKAEKIPETQPQDSAEPLAEEIAEVEDEKLLTDEEILEAAKEDETPPEEILAGDTFKEEGEITEDSLKDPVDAEEDLFSDGDESDGDDGDDDDILGFGNEGISREQEEYRHEAFRDMEVNGTWD